MNRSNRIFIFLPIAVFILASLACYRPFAVELTSKPASVTLSPITTNSDPTIPPLPTLIPKIPDFTPTPDSPHVLPTERANSEQYTIQVGDTLGALANVYGIDLNTLIAANPGVDANYLAIGQVIQIPAPVPGEPGSDLKLIPDSELIASPYTIGFDTNSLAVSQRGTLAGYTETVNERVLSGPQLVDEVAQEYSVNPRLLLSVLEYQSRFVTKSSLLSTVRNYPMGFMDPDKAGLYRQLSWAANNLNRGFYLWQIGGISHWILPDGSLVPVSSTINAGTAGIQYVMSLLHNRSEWDAAVGPNGVAGVYQKFFGSPFQYAFEPITPTPLVQPVMQLPFENNAIWSFTGGPHAGWGDGSAWAALDFAPPGEALGCYTNDAWETAVADGTIVRSDLGTVVLDLDNDGYEQTGWTVLYLHVAAQDRVGVGVKVKAGDRIGHPSCEGGIAYAAHLHIARRYNGEWITADGSTPFVMDGWSSKGTGVEYNGYLVKNNRQVEAWDARREENQIGR